jgi:septal ring-binding cell division protein DamX
MLSANPELTAAEVKEILQQTADKIGSAAAYYQGHSRKYGYGRVNAQRAVDEAIRRRELQGSTGTLGSGTTGTSNSGLFEVEVSDTVQTGWGVQVGAYSNYGNVMQLVGELKQRYRQPVYVASVNRGGRTLYLVIVGAFARINEAQLLQRQLKAEFSGAFIKNLQDL